VPKTFGRTDDFGGVTIFTPADTGFNNTAVPLNNTNSGVGVTGPVLDLSRWNRIVIVSQIDPASSVRLTPIPLDENGVALTVIDDPGNITFTLQQGFEIQDGSSPQALAGVALVKLACYGLSAASHATVRLFCKNRL